MTATKRYFALFGPRAAGKTVYLGALYGSSGDPAESGPAYHVAASEDANDPTHAYLGRVSRALKSGKWPDATGFERLEKMTLHFTCGDLAREVVLPDVGGELTQRAVDIADRERLAIELKERILAEYVDYHGFLIFVPAEPVESSRASEYKWELDSLLNALRERTPDGGTIARPFAVLVTKWDLVEPGPLNQESEAHATAYLEDTHPDLAAGLKVLCRNLRVFPISATGPTVAGFPPVPLRPTNLGEAVAWLIETAERVRLDGAIAYFERNLGNLFLRDPDDDKQRTCREVAHARLADFLEELPHGLLADEARAHVEELRRISRTRRKRQAKFAAAIFGVLTLVALGYRDNVAYHQATALLNNAHPELPRREVIARVAPVARVSFFSRPVGYSLYWWPRLRSSLSTYRADYEATSFEEVKLRSHPSDENDARELLRLIGEYEKDFPDSPRSGKITGFRKVAEDRTRTDKESRLNAEIEEDYKKLGTNDYELSKRLLAKCDSFLKDLPASRYLPRVQMIRADVRATVHTQEQAINYAALQANLAKAADAPLRCYELCSEFLKRDPTDPKAGEVRSDRDRYLRKADGQSWDELTTFAQKYPISFRERIERIDAYLANALYTVHRDEALRSKGDTIKRYDRETYNAIRTMAREGNHAATLLAVEKRCRNYLNTPIPGKTMTADVEKWVAWFDGWDTGKEIHVRVATIRIERGSTWHHRMSYSDPWVQAIVWVGTKKDFTNSKTIPLDREIRELPEDRLGPFTWKWGDPEVSVTLHHKGASPTNLTESFDDGDPFKVRHLNSSTTFDGGKIAVRLECPEVVPPTFPPYKKD
jgi:hypothetical protein